TCRGLSLPQLLRMGGGADWLQREPVIGMLPEVSVRCRGALRTPAVSFEATGKQVAARGLNLGDVEVAAEVDLAARRLRLTRLRATRGEQWIRAQGELALP